MIELQHDRSKMTFGGYDLLNMAALGSKLVYHDIDKKVMKWWTLKLNHMTVRDPTKKIDYSKYEFGKNKKLIVDSGTSFLLMPSSDRKTFVKMIEEKTGSYCMENSLPICSCKNIQNFPDLIFNVDGTEYLVPKEGYIVKRSWGMCLIGIMTHDTMSVWILGLNFFSNYYTVFDQEKYRVGFAINRYAHPRVLEFHRGTNLYDTMDLNINIQEESDKINLVQEEPSLAQLESTETIKT